MLSFASFFTPDSQNEENHQEARQQCGESADNGV